MLDTQAAYRQRMYEPITFGFLRHNGKWSLSICETLNDLRFHASGALLEPTTTMSTHTYTRTHTHTHTHAHTHARTKWHLPMVALVEQSFMFSALGGGGSGRSSLKKSRGQAPAARVRACALSGVHEGGFRKFPKGVESWGLGTCRLVSFGATSRYMRSHVGGGES